MSGVLITKGLKIGEMQIPAGFAVLPMDANLQARLVQGGDALNVNLAVLTADQVAGLVAGSYQVAALFNGVYKTVVFDATGGINLPPLRVTINAPTDVIAADRISAGGAGVFQTTIDGTSTTGEVMVLSSSQNITSVHVGFSTGTSMSLAANATILEAEMVRWDFSDADAVRGVRIYFSPPRIASGFGRYIDAYCVGLTA